MTFRSIQKLSDDFVDILRDVRPRQQIVLVYPVDKERDKFEECSYNINEELGEKTIVRFDNMSKVWYFVKFRKCYEVRFLKFLAESTESLRK